MRKLILMSLILLGMMVLPLLCGAAKQEGIIVQEGDGDLKLYYFDDNISKFESKTIIKNCSAFQVFPDGVIYCVSKWAVPYQEKNLPEFGIKLILIKEPDNSCALFSGICVNPTTQEMYFTRREIQNGQGRMALYKLSLKNGAEVKLTNDQEFLFIGIPTLSPDGKNIAFYCFGESRFKVQVAYYNMESKLTKIITPISKPVFPDGPYMGGAPVWGEKSSEIYFMAIYPNILKKQAFFPGVYKVTIGMNIPPELVYEGVFPTSSKNEIFCRRINCSEEGVWRIYPSPPKSISHDCDWGKISPSGKLIAFAVNSNFYVGKIDNGSKILLHNKNYSGPDCWWIALSSADTEIGK